MSTNKEKMQIIEEEISYTIAKFFYQYRKDNDLTQKQLAENMEIIQNKVSKIENGKYTPNLIELYEILYKLSNSSDMFLYLLDYIKSAIIKINKKIK